MLVTHERDIAACASRVVTMRDGRIVSDVVQDTPLDAAAELAQLCQADGGRAGLRDVQSDAGEARGRAVADAACRPRYFTMCRRRVARSLGVLLGRSCSASRGSP